MLRGVRRGQDGPILKNCEGAWVLASSPLGDMKGVHTGQGHSCGQPCPSPLEGIPIREPRNHTYMLKPGKGRERALQWQLGGLA